MKLMVDNSLRNIIEDFEALSSSNFRAKIAASRADKIRINASVVKKQLDLDN